jgi:HEPN domain-containing protein
MDKQVVYWIEIAEYDLETAKAMLQTGRYLYVGFMCHQVIEKALKAHIAKQGAFPPKMHNLVRLAELGDTKPLMSDAQLAFLDALAPMNVNSRYPVFKKKIGENLNAAICGDILEKTEELLSWIKSGL